MYQSEFYIKPTKEVPEDAYWKAMEASINLRMQDLKAAKAHDENLQILRKEYLDQLHSLIGQKNLSAYLTLNKKRIEDMRSARRQCPTTVEGHKELEAIRRQTVEKSMGAIKQLGIDVNKVKILQKTYKDKARALFLETIGKGETVLDNPSHEVKNQTFTPPYSGFAWTWFGSRSRGLPAPATDRWINVDTGEIGNYTSISVNGADDSDSSSITYRTALGQWFRMPSIGQVRIRVGFEAIDTGYSGSIEHEWGWSEIDLIQDVRVYAQVTSPVASERIYTRFQNPRGLRYHDTNEDTHSWEHERFSPDDPILDLNITIPGAFDRDTLVLVVVGIETYNYFWSNDCTVRSNQTQRYLVREIGLSSTGG